LQLIFVVALVVALAVRLRVVRVLLLSLSLRSLSLLLLLVVVVVVEMPLFGLRSLLRPVFSVAAAFRRRRSSFCWSPTSSTISSDSRKTCFDDVMDDRRERGRVDVEAALSAECARRSPPPELPSGFLLFSSTLGLSFSLSLFRFRSLCFSSSSSSPSPSSR
jgi:hypothetical protein